jgi:hypothetical protein
VALAPLPFPLSIPHPFPFFQRERGKLEPPLSLRERGWEGERTVRKRILIRFRKGH